MTSSTEFPLDFLWGAATSSYQIEGAALADGGGASIWHTFSHTPGNTFSGHTGDTACDHYHRYEQDIALMGALGLRAYRFSISWPRVIPTGRGRVNAQGIDFYDRLVDGLLAHAIVPMATLYHWDLPADLDTVGGWLNPEIADWFAEYAERMFARLDDRVPFWLTLNEPWVVSHCGYVTGEHAPGHRNLYEAAQVSRNLLRAHASAVQAYRRIGRHQIGLAINIEPKYPATASAADQAATARADAYMNRQYLDPIFLGSYPQEFVNAYAEAWQGDAALPTDLNASKIDFLGINYYTRAVVRNDDEAPPLRASSVRQQGSEHTDMGWEVYPQGLTQLLLEIKTRYGDVPIYITENGAAFSDKVSGDGNIDDPRRVAYLRDHLRAMHKAMQQGVDVRGYFAWSLLDNFEWSFGYAKRFGLVGVDFTTQHRTPKASARYYTEVIRRHGLPPD
jgi:beta-glucosidase